jgi:WD40 repeat protein
MVDPLHVDDVATGQRLLTLEGLCAWSTALKDRESTPGCRPFPETPFPIWVERLAYSPDGSIIAAKGDFGLIGAWDAATGRLLAAFETPSASIRILFTPDSSELLVGTADGIVAYSTDTWSITRSGPASEIGPVSPMAHLADGSLLAATRFGTLGDTWFHVVDPLTLEIRTSVRLGDSLKTLAMSPDRTRFATGGADGTVRVWDAATFEELNRLAVRGQVQGLAYVDDDQLAVTPQEGGILVETLDRADLLARVRSGLTRGFTPQECERFGLDPCPTLEELRAGPGARLSGSAVP